MGDKMHQYERNDWNQRESEKRHHSFLIIQLL